MSTTTTPPKREYKQVHLKQIVLIFRLSMPGKASWNGKWSGEGNLYALIRPLPRNLKSEAKAQELLRTGSWTYDFGDGWTARIDVEKGDRDMVRKTRQHSKGFSGYEWMVANILEHGSPYPLKK